MPFFIEADEGESIAVEVSAEYIGAGRQRYRVEVVKKTKGAKRQPLRKSLKTLDACPASGDTERR